MIFRLPFKHHYAAVKSNIIYACDPQFKAKPFKNKHCSLGCHAQPRSNVNVYNFSAKAKIIAEMKYLTPEVEEKTVFSTELGSIHGKNRRVIVGLYQPCVKNDYVEEELNMWELKAPKLRNRQEFGLKEVT